MIAGMGAGSSVVVCFLATWITGCAFQHGTSVIDGAGVLAVVTDPAIARTLLGALGLAHEPGIAADCAMCVANGELGKSNDARSA